MSSDADEKPFASTAPSSTDDVSVDEENVFYFESDHLALRGNRDYGNVLRTIALLEAQRVRLHQQHEELVIAKKRYMDDPELLLSKLKNGEELIASNYVSAIKIAEIPEVSSCYEAYLPEKVNIKEEQGTSETVEKVRGRVVDESKPESFNQLWSCEEQCELERLLGEYPPEEVEMRRYAKIAKALGNRTPQQVFSRVQKYFQKLHDAGLPVPGRKPKHRRPGQTKRKHYYRPTTFFPAYNVPVQMPEDDFLMGDLGNVQSPASSSIGATEVTTLEAEEISQMPDAQQRTLQMLIAIRDEKQTTVEGYNPDPLAAKCEECLLTPVSAARWHCNSCNCCVNLCADCLTTQLLEHKFEHITHNVVLEQDT